MKNSFGYMWKTSDMILNQDEKCLVVFLNTFRGQNSNFALYLLCILERNCYGEMQMWSWMLKRKLIFYYYSK